MTSVGVAFGGMGHWHEAAERAGLDVGWFYERAPLLKAVMAVIK